ncbi:MAG: hypothetical protein K2J08_05950 [Ruminococcus sp.]|nr:hypothetical protein [Ruminococcus sp.]
MNMYVILVKKGCENSVFSELRKRGFDAVLPLKQEFRKYGEKWRIYEKIIFVNYVFLRCDLSEKIYYEVQKIDGVICFLGNGNPQNIDFLKPYEQRYIEWLWNGGKPIESSKIYITPSGDKLVLSGILRKYSGSEIEYNLPKRKAVVCVEIDGFSHKVELPVTVI